MSDLLNVLELPEVVHAQTVAMFQYQLSKLFLTSSCSLQELATLETSCLSFGSQIHTTSLHTNLKSTKLILSLLHHARFSVLEGGLAVDLREFPQQYKLKITSHRINFSMVAHIQYHLEFISYLDRLC